MSSSTESKSKQEMPLAPEELRKEVVGQQVNLRPTKPVEKIVLPTEEDIIIEKHQQCNSPVLTEVASFDRNSLRQSTTDEKTGLPTAEEYNEIKAEKQAFREEINKFDQGKLKHVATEEKHDVAAIDEAGGK